MATVTWYTDYHSQELKPWWPTSLSSTIYLEALLRLMYFSLTALHYYIFSYNSWTPTLFKPDNSLSLHHSFHNAKPSDFNPMPKAFYISCFKGSEYHDSLGIQTQWEFLHTLLYQNRNYQLDAVTLTTTLTINLWIFSVVLLYIQIFLYFCVKKISVWLLPLPRTPTQDLPTKGLGQSRALTNITPTPHVRNPEPFP